MRVAHEARLPPNAGVLSLRLLIVENDLDLRATLAAALSDHAVTLVPSALDALASRPERFDAIVTDYRLPAMSGLELYRLLHERGIAIPVVLMSSDPNARRLARLFGFFDFLPKPFGFLQLWELLDRLARKARSAAPVE